MSIGAAVDITSPDAGKIVAAASLRAHERGEQCFVISILRSLTGDRSDEEAEIAARNLGLIASRNAAPIVHEADDVARGIVAAAKSFGVDVLFVGSPRRRTILRSVPEKLLQLAPPFEVVVVAAMT